LIAAICCSSLALLVIANVAPGRLDGRQDRRVHHVAEPTTVASAIVASLGALSRKSAPRLERMDLQQVIPDATASR
jgi:hypothetical protein